MQLILSLQTKGYSTPDRFPLGIKKKALFPENQPQGIRDQCRLRQASVYTQSTLDPKFSNIIL